MPNGIIRKSVVQKLIKNHLKNHGWFPGKKQKPAGDAGGGYYQLEFQEDGKAILHHNFEYSYLKFKHKSVRYDSIDDLIQSYLVEKQKEGLDGLKIDWKSQ